MDEAQMVDHYARAKDIVRALAAQDPEDTYEMHCKHCGYGFTLSDGFHPHAADCVWKMAETWVKIDKEVTNDSRTEETPGRRNTTTWEWTNPVRGSG